MNYFENMQWRKIRCKNSSILIQYETTNKYKVKKVIKEKQCIKTKREKFNRSPENINYSEAERGKLFVYYITLIIVN